MPNQERERKLEAYRRAPEELMSVLAQCPPEMWDWRPAPGEWCVHEIVVHLGDSELNTAIRCRQCIADPGNSIRPWDELQWATGLHYLEQDTDDARQLIVAIRRSTYKLFTLLPEGAWAHTTVHPQRGMQTLDDLLAIAVQHACTHIEQVRHNLEAWQKQHQ